MTELLSFLLYWAGRVYEGFGGLYERGRQAALYAYGWAVAEAAKVLGVAYNYVDSKTNGLLSTVSNWLAKQYYELRDYIVYVREYLISQYNGLTGWINARVQDAINFASSVTQSVQNIAARWVADLQNTVAGWIQDVRNYAAAVTLAVQNNLLGLLSQVNSDLAKIKEIVNSVNSAGTPILGTFITNPFGFILAYVWSTFQDLLCYGLAYGLGSIKYDLPPLPDWNGGGAAGGDLPPSGNPPNTSGLVSPLDVISVSGYTFGPTHPGVDLGLNNGQPVYAMAAGTVLAAEFSQVGYGFTVVISGGDWWVRYAHLQTLAVSVGDQVSAGQAVGLGDSTGNSTGPHLHLEIKYKGQFIDPLTVL